jgi:hypothetical protein
MNKLNLLLGILIGITILSCSSDDNNSEEINDPIVGVWNFVRSIDFDGQQEFEFLANNCNSQSSQVFANNGTYSFTTYDFEDPNSDCINRYFSTSGNWNLNNGAYQISYEFDCAPGFDCSDDVVPTITIENDSLKLRYSSGGSDYLDNYYVKN